MAWKVTAEAGRFDEAVDHFASRVVLSDDERKTIPADARSRAFWIAGVAQLDIVQRVQDRLAKAIADGTTVEDFKKAVRADLKTQTDAHIETVFRNATQTAYNAGRWHQMSAPSVVRFRPYWLFDAILDGRTTQVCKVCGGTLLAADDPWWDTHWPPLHHRCRSSVRCLRRSEAEKRGISAAPVVDTKGFGSSPRVAREWRPQTEGRAERLMAELERKRAELAARPPVPPIPKTFGPLRTQQQREPDPPLRTKIRIGQFQEAELTPAQQKAHQTAERMRRSYEARARAGHEDRRTWLLWDWVRGSNKRAGALMKEAALREFKSTGVPWYKGKAYAFQAADITRTQRDLRRMYEDTQASFKRRGIRTVTLYRGVYGDDPRERSTIESWTTDEAVAAQFARKGPNGRVVKVTVPVSQVLTHHQSTGWLDGPFGAQAEFLVLW
jgi:SPP1 gp7 family putative phage head morphogenesis protein